MSKSMNRRNDAYLMAPLRGAGNGESSSRGSSSLREEPKSEAQQHTYETQPQDGNMVEDFGEVEQNEPSARTSLEQALGERHVNMMTFSAVIGVGLFLQNSRLIYLAGPGWASLAYPIMGTIIWSVQAALGEMTALFPVVGALFELPCRFLDRSIGFAVGWMAWFSWVVIMAAEIDAVAGLFNFKVDPSLLEDAYHYPRPTLQWSTVGTSPAIWVSIFLAGVWSINFIRVRWFGEIEYWIGVMKMIFIVGLIIFNVIINVQTGTHFRYYRSPLGFMSKTFTTWKGDVWEGPVANLAGIWSAFTVTLFSMIGMETVSVTAAENKKYVAQHRIKMSTRKIVLRILLLYTLATFVVGLNVPSDDPSIRNPDIQALGGGQHSAFVIAAVRAGKTFWPGFFTGFFVLSATSSGINSLYISSRLLHALALSHQAWPKWKYSTKLRERLAQTGSKGVPGNAVIASGMFGFLAYLAGGSAPQQGGYLVDVLGIVN